MERRTALERRRSAEDAVPFFPSRESRLARSESCVLASDASSSRRLATRASLALVASLLMPVSGKFRALVSTLKTLATS
jgi:hypothetical protein